MTTPTKWVSPHRQGAMELNPDMVQKIDDEIEFELDTMPDTEIVRHWMFSDVSYRKALADLIVAAQLADPNGRSDAGRLQVEPLDQGDDEEERARDDHDGPRRRAP